jgi:hypothetical protein
MPPKEYAREFFTWWDEPSAELLVIPMDDWERQSSTALPTGTPAGFAVDMTPDRAWTSIGVYADHVVDLVEHRHGSGWLLGCAKRLWARWKVPFAIDPKGPAANEIQSLREAGIDVIEPTGAEVVRSCADLYDAFVDDKTLWHTGRPELDAAMEGAKKRDVGDGFVWDRKKGAVISPLYAITLARWVAVKDEDYDVLESIY